MLGIRPESAAFTPFVAAFALQPAEHVAEVPPTPNWLSEGVPYLQKEASREPATH